MRDYINRLSRGKSIYEIPKLNFEGEQVSGTVVCGEFTQGSFPLTAAEEVKGLVYSNEERVTLVTSAYRGAVWIVEYRVDARGLAENDEIEGMFVVESNAGEKEIPFAFKCAPKTVMTSAGEVGNVIQFANLVQMYPEEAEKLFLSEEFKTVVLSGDEHLSLIYDTLVDEKHVSESIEEFLIAVKKKSAINIAMSGEEKAFEVNGSNEKDVISLQKSGWGYEELKVYVDVPYVSVEKNSITTLDFTGDRYDLEYIVLADKLHAGNNYAKIIIHTHNQELEYRISINNLASVREEEGQTLAREKRMTDLELTREYLKFRMKKTKKESWISNTNKLVERARGLSLGDPFYELVQAQIYLISGREEEGRWILENLKGDILDKINSNVELYCFYLYVRTLLERSEEYTAQVEKQVKHYYDNGHSSYRLLWILLYLNADTESNKSIRLLRIKDEFANSKSPVMYLEAINILNSQPVLLRVLNSFEMQVLTFAKKYDLIGERLATQISMVAANEREASDNLLSILKYLYEKYEMDEILTTLVTHMVRLGLVGKSYFEIYEKGVLRELRITRLYEYYIASMEKDLSKHLPKIVLMYFAYDASLVDADKAFVYANVLKNKSAYKGVFDKYEKNIEIFAYEMVKAGKLDSNLAVIYQYMAAEQMVKAETKDFLMKLKFAYKVRCFDEEAEYVVVRHSEFSEPARYQLIDGNAFVYMYSSNCVLSFLCEDGVTRKGSINYEVERVFADESGNWTGKLKDEDFVGFEFDNDGVLINKANEYHRRKESLGKALEMYKKVKGLDSISQAYKSKVNTWMVEYYSDHYILDDFWHEYPSVDTEGLEIATAGKLCEVLINFGMYAQAYELVCKYGPAEVASARLLKMLDYILTNVSSEEKEHITQLTRYVFNNKIYNEPILEYMVSYFNGTNDEMYNVWKSAINFGLDVTPISERILAQMLFTNVHSGRLTEVFGDYYCKNPDMLIVKAYLAYNAQLYLIRQKKPNDIVFRAIEECMIDGIGLPECCMVAWAKELSKNPLTIDRESNTVKLLANVVEALCKENRVYEFFKRFEGVIELPYNVLGVTVMEHISNPDNKVTITYSINDSETETTDVCKNNEWGIFTYRFNLFYGDRVKYYFTVSGSKENTQTQNYSFEYSEISQESVNGRFDAINDCLASKDLHDMVTLKKLMHSYSVEDYVTKQLFKPMK